MVKKAINFSKIKLIQCRGMPTIGAIGVGFALFSTINVLQILIHTTSYLHSDHGSKWAKPTQLSS